MEMAEALTGVLVRDTTTEHALEDRRNSFISIASHALRPPLTTIMGFSEILLSKESPRSVQQEWVRAIHNDGLRLSRIVDELLNLSRIQAGKLNLNLAPWSVQTVAEESVALVRPITANHHLVLSIPPELPVVWTDREKLVQVVVNLLTNVVKYSPAGGRITVYARHEPTGSG